jgi:Domain of unknown function (DUF4253)
MPNPHRSRVTADLRLVEHTGGLVHVEIETSEPLEEFTIDERYGGFVERPVEYLNRMPSSLAINCLDGDQEQGSGWRYIRVASEALVDGTATSLVDRYLDLSADSDERRMFERLSEQFVVRVWWVNEHVQVLQSYPPVEQRRWQEALANTEGISREAWEEELADRAWRKSASWRPGPRPRTGQSGVVKAPATPVPFFARRSGEIPHSGTPELAGVSLPPGRRYPRPYSAAYWCSDDAAPDVWALAELLADSFRDTGVWPLLWRFEEDPDVYMGGHGDLPAIDAVDVAAALRELWESAGSTPAATYPFTTFPGLAASAQTPVPRQNPFAGLARAGEAARLLLVPCNRPADAITALGGLACETAPPLISAVLRSWEERFAAVAYAVMPRAVGLSVTAPPLTMDHALALAAEHHCFCPREDAGRAGAPRRLAGELLGDPGAVGDTASWQIAWHD